MTCLHPVRATARALALAVLVAACGDAGAPAGPAMTGPRLHGGDEIPTSLRVTKTATAARTREVSYDWTLQKSVAPASAELAEGASRTFTYTLTATRSETSATEWAGVSGEICVQNVGGGATRDLGITDNVQASTNGGATWTTIASATVDLGASPAVAAQTTTCYPYTVVFTPVDGALYRNEAYVTITNWSGAPGQLVAFERYAAFTLPDAVTTAETDESATLSDALTCPAGFTCAPVSGGWSLTGSAVETFEVTITRAGAPCGGTWEAVNAATLTEGDSGTERTAGASVTLTTPGCDPPPSFEGCTPGYWKQRQHFGNWTGFVPTGPGASRYDATFGVSLFGAERTLLQALSTGGGGWKRLGRHSTAALLNASHSTLAYGMTPAQVVDAVRAAVASGNPQPAADAFEERNERSCPLGRA